MAILLFIVAVVVVLFLLVWVINSAPFKGTNVPVAKWALIALLVLIAVVLILQKAGVTHLPA